MSPRERDAAIRANYDAVRRYCISRTDTAEEAEDAVQETFVRFLERADGDVANVQAWLIRAAGWTCADIRRRARVRAAASLSDDPELATVPGVEDGVVEATLVRDVLDGVHAHDAGILRDVYLAGASVVEVARARGLPAGSVRMMLMRARRRARLAVGAVGTALGALRLWRARNRRQLEAAAEAELPRLSAAGLAGAGLALALAMLPSGAISTLPAGAAAPPPAATGGVTPVTPRPPGAVTAAVALQPPHRLPHLPVPAVLSPNFPPLPIGLPIDPGANATTNNGRFTYLVPTPDYLNPNPPDHGAVFALGKQSNSCQFCGAVLFVTHDRGKTWTRKPGADNVGYGPLLVSPNYAHDTTLFILNNLGLEISRDAGETWNLTPLRGPLSLGDVATAPAGGPRVAVVEGDQVLSYDADSQLIGPGAVLPPDLIPTSLVFGGGGSDVLVGGKQAESNLSEVALCGLGAGQVQAPTCFTRQMGPQTKADSWLDLARPRPLDSTLTVLLWGPTGAYTSDVFADGFAPLAVPVELGLITIDPMFDFATNGGNVIIASLEANGQAPTYTLTEGQIGAGFSSTFAVGVPGVLDSQVWLEDGRVLASRLSPADPSLLGIYCKLTSASAWTATC